MIGMPHDTPYIARLRELAQSHRMVFIAGLPGVGKSLLLRELAEAAHRHGRRVHLLQWDVARRPFDAPALLARYPEVDGITHAVLRKAVGLWARDAVSTWAEPSRRRRRDARGRDAPHRPPLRRACEAGC